ncbi:hypothetical protein KFL_005350110 [Klebsormidium nitens]|uniref:Uncharacterized protein n=1 Tax=Klebsormidium nitens TaxID=105231 RepID=A0A1Y1ILB4_KLENI|nr:hypothetical protein KFL_005350110 [Klebsormidium nitens]|eukprot:GAQ89556.1 hypothetical protein KFL_005350110 [Klebsormidium nitens]
MYCALDITSLGLTSTKSFYNGVRLPTVRGSGELVKPSSTDGGGVDGRGGYMSVGKAVKEALWFRKLGGDLGLDLETVLIYCNNQRAMRLLKHPIASQQSKHIDVIHHFAQKRMAQKEVEIAYCKTEDMKANTLTKALAPGNFLKCKRKLGIA